MSSSAAPAEPAPAGAADGAPVQKTEKQLKREAEKKAKKEAEAAKKAASSRRGKFAARAAAASPSASCRTLPSTSSLPPALGCVSSHARSVAIVPRSAPNETLPRLSFRVISRVRALSPRPRPRRRASASSRTRARAFPTPAASDRASTDPPPRPSSSLFPRVARFLSDEMRLQRWLFDRFRAVGALLRLGSAAPVSSTKSCTSERLARDHPTDVLLHRQGGHGGDASTGDDPQPRAHGPRSAARKPLPPSVVLRPAVWRFRDDPARAQA